MIHAAILALLVALPAQASDGVPSRGELSDRDFFRLATCGAAPGKRCAGPTVRWRAARVTIALSSETGGVPRRVARAVPRALDRAIARINAVGAGVQLVLIDNTDAADIVVHRVPLFEGDPTRGIEGIPDGEIIGVGYFYCWWNAARFLTEATVLISADINPDQLDSVMLEEVFQSLGFRFDIENPAYEDRSILAQDSNSVTRIQGQDAAILHMLYPN